MTVDLMTTDYKTKGRPRDETKRIAIETLLSSGMNPAMVRKVMGASLTLIYEVRRSMTQIKEKAPATDQDHTGRVSTEAENRRGDDTP
jgi:hypothetical protein